MNSIYFAPDLKTNIEIKTIGQQVLLAEMEGLQSAAHNLPDSFAEIVQSVLSIKGRLVLTGIGKSALIARKITATLNSTGTPSVFMHAAEAIHGDLGMVQPQDFVLAFSHSGNTPEIVYLSNLIKKLNLPFAAITGNKQSTLAKNAQFVLDYSIEKEACPLNLAPTTSTTIQLALGDALAVALLSSRNFNATDFSKYHPGGNLGKKLYLTCGDMALLNEKPQVNINDSLSMVINEISSKRMGACAVLQNNALVGMITDGDIRRLLEKQSDLSLVNAAQMMSLNPKWILDTTLAVDAFDIFNKHKISQLVVLDANNIYIGMIHLHDLHKEGL